MCINCKWNVSDFPGSACVPFPRQLIMYANIPKSKQIWNLKHFWFRALWIRDAKCVLTTDGRWWMDGALGLPSNPASPWISEGPPQEILLHKNPSTLSCDGLMFCDFSGSSCSFLPPHVALHVAQVGFKLLDLPKSAEWWDYRDVALPCTSVILRATWLQLSCLGSCWCLMPSKLAQYLVLHSTWSAAVPGPATVATILTDQRDSMYHINWWVVVLPWGSGWWDPWEWFSQWLASRYI